MLLRLNNSIKKLITADNKNNFAYPFAIVFIVPLIPLPKPILNPISLRLRAQSFFILNPL